MIPTMIVGIFLLLAWFPTIIITELNNKGNVDELKYLKTVLESSEISITSVTLTKDTDATNITYNDLDIITNDSIPTAYSNENLYVVINKTITTTEIINGKTQSVNKIETDYKTFKIPSVDGEKLSETNFKYLAGQREIDSKNITNGDTKYDITFYSIDLTKKFFKITGIDKEKADIDIYEIEMANNVEEVKEIILKRKTTSNKLQMWLWRLGTFMMMFFGLTSLVTPFRVLSNMLDKLTFGVPILSLPIRFVLNIYDTLSFFGALLITALMTLLVWTIINKPLISVLIAGLIVGLNIYFNKK
jgi:hypothetical protein